MNAAPFHKAGRSGMISDLKLDEVSGILASRKNRQILWMVNDSGNAPILYAVSRAGMLLNEYPIMETENTDWEDLSGFRHND